MSTKNVYFYKLSLYDTQSRQEMNLTQTKTIIEQIIANNVQNNAVSLSYNDAEPIVMDVLQQTNDYLFARLSKKRRNNSIQRRNYNTLETSPVLTPAEEDNNGIEIFTYCILGYNHGILSIAKNQGAPNEEAFNRMFSKYNDSYYLEIDSVPNNQLINEIYNGTNPQINRMTIEIPTPNAEILEKVLGASDSEILQSVQQKTNIISFEIRPEKRGALCDEPSVIQKVINLFKAGKDTFSKVVLDAKPDSKTRQKRYDLYEEYFKYPININEYHMENGRKVENPKEQIQADYKNEMINIYNNYREYILTICNRI